MADQLCEIGEDTFVETMLLESAVKIRMYGVLDDEIRKDLRDAHSKCLSIAENIVKVLSGGGA